MALYRVNKGPGDQGPEDGIGGGGNHFARMCGHRSQYSPHFGAC